MIALLTGLLLFLGVHSASIVAPGGVQRLKSRLGANAWRGIYSLISLAGFALLVYGYGLARAEGVIYYVPPMWLRYVAVVLMVFVFPLVIAAYLPGRIKLATKHPMLVATKLWATAHLLANGSRADVILFGALLVWAVADRISLKRRPVQSPPQLGASSYNDAIAIVAGLVLYGVFVLGLHARLFGVPVPGPWSSVF